MLHPQYWPIVYAVTIGLHYELFCLHKHRSASSGSIVPQWCKSGHVSLSRRRIIGTVLTQLLADSRFTSMGQYHHIPCRRLNVLDSLLCVREAVLSAHIADSVSTQVSMCCALAIAFAFQYLIDRSPARKLLRRATADLMESLLAYHTLLSAYSSASRCSSRNS